MTTGHRDRKEDRLISGIAGALEAIHLVHIHVNSNQRPKLIVYATSTARSARSPAHVSATSNVDQIRSLLTDGEADQLTIPAKTIEHTSSNVGLRSDACGRSG